MTDLQKKVLRLVEARLSALESGKPYTLEAIIGPDWDEYTAGEHVWMGRSFSGLVDMHAVPFVAEGLTKRHHATYVYMGA